MNAPGTVSADGRNDHPGTYGAGYGLRHPYAARAVRVRTGATGTEPSVSTPLRTSPDAARSTRSHHEVMQAAERDRGASEPSTDVSTEDGPALRDAADTAARIAEDEQAAAAAREQFRVAPVPTIGADAELLPHLAPGELVHDLRKRAILKAPGDDRSLGYGGTLYLTSHRLVHLGQVVMSVQLTDVIETSLAGERLLLSLRDGEGLSIEVDRPRLLRAEMAEVGRRLRR